MLKLESKVGKVFQPAEKIYRFLSDFNNFSHLVPADKVKNWEATADTCKFSLDGIGNIGFKIIEKEPDKMIKVSGFESKYDFTIWMQLKQLSDNETAMKFTLHANLNLIIEAMAKKPLQNFLDMLVERIGGFSFQES